MNSPAMDIVDILNGNAGLTIGTNLFGFEWGTSVSKQVLVRDTGSASTDNINIYENPTVQILVRGDKKESGKSVYDFAKPVEDYLLSLLQRDQGGAGYVLFQPITTLTSIGRDDEGRYVYTSNWLTYRT